MSGSDRRYSVFLLDPERLKMVATKLFFLLAAFGMAEIGELVASSAPDGPSTERVVMSGISGTEGRTSLALAGGVVSGVGILP